MPKSFKKSFIAELVEIGDLDATGEPTATFQWNDDEGNAHLAKIEMPPEDLRDMARAFYSHVRITIEFPPREETDDDA